MTINTPDDSSSQSLWANLGPVEQARGWERFRPGTFEQVFELAKLDAHYRRDSALQAARHERRLDYIAVAIQVLGLVFALGAVIVLALTARYYADHNAADQGVKIFGFGAGSIVAAFIGVNFTPLSKRIKPRSRRSKRKNPD